MKAIALGALAAGLGLAACDHSANDEVAAPENTETPAVDPGAAATIAASPSPAVSPAPTGPTQ